MRVLLDTHVLLWAGTAPEALSDRARAILADPAAHRVWSVVGTAELAIKAGRKRLTLPVALEEFLEDGRADLGLEFLRLEHRHSLRLAHLPLLHGDPFDRLLVAQALEEDLPLLTKDAVLARYGVEVVW